MKTTITNAIKILLATALVIAAQQYTQAVRNEVDTVAVEYAKMGRQLSESGKTWPETEQAVRELLVNLE